MAEVNGANSAKVVGEPTQKVSPGELTGRVKILYDEYTFPAAAFAANDTILWGGRKLPAGARVVEAVLKIPATLGATGIFTMGFKANGVDTADPDAFVGATDAGGQSAVVRGLAEAGIGKKFSVDTEVHVTCTEVTTAATGVIMQGWLFYVMD